MIVSILGLAAAAAPSLAEPPLRPLSALVGHCWTGAAPGNGGTDKHCFESIYGGQHVRDRHVVTSGGQAVYAGESIYSAKGPQVIFTYWNSLGGLGTGNALLDGREWRFSGTIHATATAAEEPMVATWKMVDGGYEVTEGAEAPRLFKRAD
ncbi:MAG: hypothetical protein ACJ8FT_11690 [Sphingomonas sp.]